MEINEVEAQQEVESVTEEVETLEEASPEEQDTTDWKAKYEETAGRLKRAETKLDKSRIKQKAEEIVEKQKNNGELDETQLDYLDLKGITDSEEIEVIRTVMNRTGQTLRETLKDDYVQGKLEKLRAAREVKEAMPSTGKRSANNSTADISGAVAKFEKTGELPADFELASKVVDAIESKAKSNKPTWHK